MIILSANDITKAYGVDTILENVSFHINAGDRIGIIGANGAGKTTLLKILSGEMPYESGNFFVSQNTRIGYLKQNDNFDSSNTLIEEVDRIFKPLHDMEAEMLALSEKIARFAEEETAAAGSSMSPEHNKLMERYATLQDQFALKGGYTYKSEIKGILNSMAFGEDFYNKKIGTLSGGERTRLALACLLLEKPELLFLDEPTNHLDIGTLKWLEQYLKGYTGTILLVSHDRYFLDQTVNRIFEIENHKLYTYTGSYSTFAEQKRQRRESELRAYNIQQREIKRQEEIIRRFKEHNTEHLTKRAASREKRLAHVERIDKPEAEVGKMKIHFKQEFKSGNDVLYGEKLSKSFGYGTTQRQLFNNVNFDIKRGERICIVGPNGVGKTTLLKIMMDELEPNGGYMKLGHNVVFGYYDQGQQLLNDENTVLDEVHDSYRLYSDTEVRSILGRFLFRNDQVFNQVKSLSGGERARLSLLKLMLSGANVLILDEPTNHLDIDSKEIFEDALMDFTGTVIVVSHDRYFLNKIPTRILELEQDGFHEYLGKYNYYVEKKASIESGKKYLQGLGGKEKSGSQNKPDSGKASDPSGFNAGASGDAQTTRTQGSVQADMSGTLGSDQEAGATDCTAGAQLSPAEQRALAKKKEAEERRIARRKTQLEMDIDSFEKEIKNLEEEMCKPANLANHPLLAQLDAKLKETKQSLAAAEEEWLTLA